VSIWIKALLSIAGTPALLWYLYGPPNPDFSDPGLYLSVGVLLIVVISLAWEWREANRRRALGRDAGGQID